MPPRGRALALCPEWERAPLPLLVLRVRGGGLGAYLNRCPHQGVLLSDRPQGLFDRSRRHLLCDTHGALFRPDDGLCVQGPCAGDRLDALEAFELLGQVQVFVSPALAEELRRRRALFAPPAPRLRAPGEPDPAGPGGSTRG